MAINCSGDMLYNSSSGVTGQVYGCRMWIFFNGGSSYVNNQRNVSSLVRLGQGIYQINFSNAMPTLLYGVSGTCGSSSDSNRNFEHYEVNANWVKVATYRSSDGSNQDVNHIFAQVFL